MILKKSLGVFLFGAALSATRLPAQSAATVTIQAGQPGAVVSSNLFGIFFEEINFAGEGGIYSEMVRDRTFYNSNSALYWTSVTQGSATGGISVAGLAWIFAGWGWITSQPGVTSSLVRTSANRRKTTAGNLSSRRAGGVCQRSSSAKATADWDSSRHQP